MNKKLTTNHLEGVFDIAPGTTISTAQPRTSIVTTNDSDTSSLINEEDAAVASQLQTIYGYAIDAFEQQTQLISEVDPRFAARNAEVAAQYLNIALNSANSRASIRHNKLKLKVDRNSPQTVNQNLFMADRNTILKMLSGESS